MDRTKELAEKAARVAQVAAARDEAFEQAKREGAEMLRQAAKASRPGLKAVSSRIVGGEKRKRPEYINTKDFGRPEDLKGLLVAEAGWEVRSEPGGSLGFPEPRYVGRRLYLTEDGRWIELDRDGPAGPLSEDYWDASWTYLEPEDVVGTWKAEKIVDAISAAFDAQLAGGNVARTEEARTAAERYRALSTLLTPPPRKGRK